MANTITPHKGGRTLEIKCRVSPTVKKTIRDITNNSDISFGDMVEWLAANYPKETIPHEKANTNTEV